MAIRQTDEAFGDIYRNVRSTISDLCELYDGGKAYVAFALANEINKFLTTGDKITSVRKDRVFHSIDFEYSERNLLAEHKLIIAEIHGHSAESEPYYVLFKPAFVDNPHGLKPLLFRDWWNRDVVWRASAALDQKKPWAIPVNPDNQVPRQKRSKYVRREIITLVRNKLGSHIDREIPEELDSLQRSNSFGINVELDVGGKTLSTMEGTLPMKIGPLAAMIRQIAHELLEAFPPEFE